MNKINKNQSGFSVVEFLLVILILVVIGAVGYMVYHNDHKTKVSSLSTTNSSKSTTNPYAGWKTYSISSPTSFSFKYPTNWTLSTSDNPSTNTATVTSPARNIDGTEYKFGITLVSYSSGSDPFLAAQYTDYSSTPVTDPNFPSSLYYLIAQEPQTLTQQNNSCWNMDIEASSKTFSSGGVIQDYTLPTSNQDDTIFVDGNYSKTDTTGLAYDDTLGCFTPSDFSSFQEVQQAEKIISSLSEN
jgi:Tfp pilus assembly protein PilE